MPVKFATVSELIDYDASTAIVAWPRSTHSQGYAIWTRIGAVGTAILGIVLFAEPATRPRLACITLIFVGITGLQLTPRNGGRTR